MKSLGSLKDDARRHCRKWRKVTSFATQRENAAHLEGDRSLRLEQNGHRDTECRYSCVDDAMARSLLGTRLGVKVRQMIKLTWLPHWHAYAVRRDGRIVGMIRCKIPLPFRSAVEFA